MRVSTPGLFSTRIERMCLRPVRTAVVASSSSSVSGSLVPGSPISPTISRAAAPGAIIGYVFSSRVTRTSTTTGPGVAIAVAQVGDQRRLVGQPHAGARRRPRRA